MFAVNGALVEPLIQSKREWPLLESPESTFIVMRCVIPRLAACHHLPTPPMALLVAAFARGSNCGNVFIIWFHPHAQCAIRTNNADGEG